jgi:putative toxin-antitoxin system antitoxin component (TIGR02293 family)
MLSTRADLRDAITHGKVTGNRVRALRLSLGLTVADLARVLGVSERSVNRFEMENAGLTTAEADRAHRLARTADLATDFIGDAERAKRWLKSPNRYLGGETPVAAIETELGSDLVRESLSAIAYGGVG